MKHKLTKKLYLWAASISVVAATLVLAGMGSPGSATASGGRDYDNNAVMHGGALSLQELCTKYKQNQGGNTQAIFREFGVHDGCDHHGMVEGRVTARNEVYVGDKLVATDAYTAGRQPIDRRGGTSTPIAGGAAYRRQPSVSFADSNGSLPAFVKLDSHGNFKYAVIKSCGNPVTAKPVKVEPVKAKPVAKPVVKPELKPDFTIEKDVRNLDPTDWLQHVSARRGDRLEYRVVIRNTGETELRDVVFRDSLPQGIEFTSGSVHVDGSPQAHLTLDSANVGNIPVGGTRTVTYQAEVSSTAEACGGERLRNLARVKPKDLPEKSDDATVEVCVPQVKSEVTVLPETGAGETLGVMAFALTIGGALARNVYVAVRARS